MARRIKVFFLVLFASAFFSISVNAEFSSNDSLNLSSIRSDVSTIRGYISDLSDIAINTSYSKSIYNWMVNHVSGLASYLDDFRRDFDDINSSINSVNSSVSVTNSWLSQIKSVLDQILAALGWRGIPVYHEFQNSLEYCDSWNNGSRLAKNIVMPNASGDAFVWPTFQGENVFLGPGVYVVSVQTNIRWFFNGYSDWVDGSKSVTVKFDGLSQILFKISSAPAWFIVDIYPADSDQLGDQVFDKVGSSVSDKTSSVNSGVNQLEGLEDQVFGSLDTSIGSIDFSGSALGQVVSGFNFIRAVFSAVYSSSPYISVLINLSCMFGVLALFLRVQPRFSRWERERRDRSD